MIGRIARPENMKLYRCDICEAGHCDLSFEECGALPCYCPFDREFGKIKWWPVDENDHIDGDRFELTGE